MEAPHVEGELSLREVQLASLSILRKIDAICRAEGIRYWLMYGSLIGAIRHHGFIPWDDDLDIAMPRPDYEKFLAYFREHADELRPLVALDGYRQRLPFLITRVSDTTYRMVGEYGDEVPELGAFVDVYPIDGCGNDADKAEKIRERCARELLMFERAENFDPYSTGIKSSLKRTRAFLLGDSRHYAEKLHQMAVRQEYDESELVACLEWENDLLWPRSWVLDLRQTTFEDATLPIPSGYDDLLRLKYGDYMALPPQGERVGHHFYSIVRR